MLTEPLGLQPEAASIAGKQSYAQEVLAKLQRVGYPDWCPPCIKAALALSEDELKRQPRALIRVPRGELLVQVETSVTLVERFNRGEIKKIPPEKAITRLADLLIECRCRDQAGPEKAGGDQLNPPQPPRLVSASGGHRSVGTRQLAAATAAGNKVPLTLQTTQYARLSSAAARPAAAPSGRVSKFLADRCFKCEELLPEGSGPLSMCDTCSLPEQGAAHNTARPEGSSRPLFGRHSLQTAAAPKIAATTVSGRETRLAPLNNINFYSSTSAPLKQAKPIGRGLTPPLLQCLGSAGGIGGATTSQEPAGSKLRSKKSTQPPQQQRQQRQQRQPGKDVGGDNTDTDYQPETKRGGSAVRTRQQRRSAPAALPAQVPIDLVDSSDGEAAAEADDERRRTEAAAGPGPSSAAAAARGVATRRKGRAAKCAYLSLSEKLAGLKCCYPVQGGKHSVEVVAEDLARLEKGEFLNDTCIDFYNKYLELHLPHDRRERYHFFNVFFLKKLQEKVPAGGKQLSKVERTRLDHDRVKKWTKHVDLFSKDFIFVPIHGALHWSLVLICHPGNVAQGPQYEAPQVAEGVQRPAFFCAGTPVMLHLDSLDGGSHSPDAIFGALRCYLNHEWAHKSNPEQEPRDSLPARWAAAFRTAGKEVPTMRFDATTLPGISMNPRLPKQDNHTDCGLFLLAYTQFFTAADPKCIILNGTNAGDVHALEPLPEAADELSFMNKTWFNKVNTGQLRDFLRMLVCELMRDRMTPEDPRHSVAEAVVSEYNTRSVGMGLRYLDPKDYLRVFRERGIEPDPSAVDADVLSGSENEGVVEEPMDVDRSRRLTRAAAKQAGIKPSKAGPFRTDAAGQTVGVKPRRVREGFPYTRTAGSTMGRAGSTASASVPTVMDLASPETLPPSSPNESRQHMEVQQEAPEDPLDLTLGEQASGGQQQGVQVALVVHSDSDEEQARNEPEREEKRAPGVVGLGRQYQQPQAAGTDGERTEGNSPPPAKRLKREARVHVLAAPPAELGAAPSAASGGQAEPMELSTDDEDGNEPPPRPRRLRREAAKKAADPEAVAAAEAMGEAPLPDSSTDVPEGPDKDSMILEVEAEAGVLDLRASSPSCNGVAGAGEPPTARQETGQRSPGTGPPTRTHHEGSRDPDARRLASSDDGHRSRSCSRSGGRRLASDLVTEQVRTRLGGVRLEEAATVKEQLRAAAGASGESQHAGRKSSKRRKGKAVAAVEAAGPPGSSACEAAPPTKPTCRPPWDLHGMYDEMDSGHIPGSDGVVQGSFDDEEVGGGADGGDGLQGGSLPSGGRNGAGGCDEAQPGQVARHLIADAAERHGGLSVGVGTSTSPAIMTRTHLRYSSDEDKSPTRERVDIPPGEAKTHTIGRHSNHQTHPSAQLPPSTAPTTAMPCQLGNDAPLPTRASGCVNESSDPDRSTEHRRTLQPSNVIPLGAGALEYAIFAEGACLQRTSCVYVEHSCRSTLFAQHETQCEVLPRFVGFCQQPPGRPLRQPGQVSGDTALLQTWQGGPAAVDAEGEFDDVDDIGYLCYDTGALLLGAQTVWAGCAPGGQARAAQAGVLAAGSAVRTNGGVDAHQSAEQAAPLPHLSPQVHAPLHVSGQGTHTSPKHHHHRHHNHNNDNNRNQQHHRGGDPSRHLRRHHNYDTHPQLQHLAAPVQHLQCQDDVSTHHHHHVRGVGTEYRKGPPRPLPLPLQGSAHNGPAVTPGAMEEPQQQQEEEAVFLEALVDNLRALNSTTGVSSGHHSYGAAATPSHSTEAVECGRGGSGDHTHGQQQCNDQPDRGSFVAGVMAVPAAVIEVVKIVTAGTSTAGASGEGTHRGNIVRSAADLGAHAGLHDWSAVSEFRMANAVMQQPLVLQIDCSAPSGRLVWDEVPSGTTSRSGHVATTSQPSSSHMTPSHAVHAGGQPARKPNRTIQAQLRAKKQQAAAGQAREATTPPPAPLSPTEPKAKPPVAHNAFVLPPCSSPTVSTKVGHEHAGPQAQRPPSTAGPSGPQSAANSPGPTPGVRQQGDDSSRDLGGGIQQLQQHQQQHARQRRRSDAPDSQALLSQEPQLQQQQQQQSVNITEHAAAAEVEQSLQSMQPRPSGGGAARLPRLGVAAEERSSGGPESSLSVQEVEEGAVQLAAAGGAAAGQSSLCRAVDGVRASIEAGKTLVASCTGAIFPLASSPLKCTKAFLPLWASSTGSARSKSTGGYAAQARGVDLADLQDRRQEGWEDTASRYIREVWAGAGPGVVEVGGSDGPAAEAGASLECVPDSQTDYISVSDEEAVETGEGAPVSVLVPRRVGSTAGGAGADGIVAPGYTSRKTEDAAGHHPAATAGGSRQGMVLLKDPGSGSNSIVIESSDTNREPLQQHPGQQQQLEEEEESRDGVEEFIPDSGDGEDGGQNAKAGNWAWYGEEEEEEDVVAIPVSVPVTTGASPLAEAAAADEGVTNLVSSEEGEGEEGKGEAREGSPEPQGGSSGRKPPRSPQRQQQGKGQQGRQRRRGARGPAASGGGGAGGSSGRRRGSKQGVRRSSAFDRMVQRTLDGSLLSGEQHAGGEGAAAGALGRRRRSGGGGAKGGTGRQSALQTQTRGRSSSAQAADKSARTMERRCTSKIVNVYPRTNRPWLPSGGGQRAASQQPASEFDLRGDD